MARQSSQATDSVVVTGLGMFTALGSDLESTWAGLLRGTDGCGPLTRFPDDDYRVRRACEARADARGTGVDDDLKSHITHAAAREAAADAGILPLRDAARVGLVFGTLGGRLGVYEDQVRARGSAALDECAARYLMPADVARSTAALLGCAGRVATVLTACSAGNQALALARRWILAGRADAMFVAGSETITQTQYTHFHNLRALDPACCRPFDRQRRGLVLGEGAGVLVVESERFARARGARIQARVLGAAASSDGHHMTAPEPGGHGARRSILGALRDAGLRPGDVDYVSAHGTGTPWNDRVEAQILLEVFGARRVPASSIKSMLGHCMGAASVIESVACVLALRDQIAPPTIHYEQADPECPIDCVPNEARPMPMRVVLNQAFGFGGNNCAVVLGAADA